MRPLVSCQDSLSPSLVFAVSLCNLEALCWCEKAVVVSDRPVWRPPASPIHPGAFPGGCLCVECSTPWSLGPNGVWERGLGFFSLCSAVQTCCHTAAPATSFSVWITILPWFLSVCLSVCYVQCLSHLSVCYVWCHICPSVMVLSLRPICPVFPLDLQLQGSRQATFNFLDVKHFYSETKIGYINAHILTWVSLQSQNSETHTDWTK